MSNSADILRIVDIALASLDLLASYNIKAAQLEQLRAQHADRTLTIEDLKQLSAEAQAAIDSI